MKFFSFSVFLCLLFSSCSSTLFIKNNESSYKELNNKIKEKECEITLTNGDTYIGSNVEIKVDSISWFDINDTSESILQPTSEIHCVTLIDRSLGMGKGFGFGILIGGGIGYLFGKRNESSGGGGFILPKISGYEPILGTLIGAVSGILLGTLYGKIKGDREIYILNSFINEEQEIIKEINEDNYRNDFFTIQVNSIINETEKSMTVLWGIKGIEIPISEIIYIIKNEKVITIKINKDTYNAYFK